MAKQEDIQNIIPGGRLFLERPRIDRLLEKALQSHAVTVVAGEGYGKTYAVNSFLQTDSRLIIWVQLSERDNLTWRFWENYTGEIARLNPKAAKIFANIGFPETDRQLDRYLTLIKNETITHEPYVIVFDDFHLITNPVILRYLNRSLAAPVLKNPIVLISRTEPGINSLGLLAKGLLSQIAVEDLRFTEEEISDYFRLNDIPLEAGALARIYRDTEGWALAVDLIVREIKAGYAEGETPGWDRIMKPVRDIEEEIFSSMGRDLQKFLIKLSLIEHWPRSLLEILDPGEKNISAMGQFTSLVRFDTYLHGFRIHHLFLEFLREKQGNLAPEEIREVYTRDAQWCMENNLSIDAAVDYERARDYGGLLRVIYALPPLLSNTMASFFLETLNRLIPEIGDDEENEDRLFLWFIIRPRLLMFLGRFEEAAGEFRKAISRFESQPPGPRCSGLLALAYCSMGTLTILSCRYTRDYNFVSWFERGYHYYLEHPEAVPGQRIYSNLTSYVFQVGAPAEPGEIERSIKALTLAVPYASSALNGFLYGTDSLASAELAYYRGDLINAEKFARQAVYQGREKKQYEVENRGLFYLIRICIHTGNFTEIRELERQLEVQLEISDYYNRYVIYDIIMGRFYARIGLIDKVASWLRDTVDAGELNGLFGDFDVLIKAQCFFIEKKYLSALHILEEEKKRNNLGSFLLGKLEMAVLEAAARYHLGEEEQALAVLEEAYTMAAPNALDMPFIERGEDMRLLAGAILAREGSPARCGRIPRPWLENIRSRSSAYSKQVSLVLEQYREEKQAEQKAAVYLTRREREVLTGLARGLKRENIARETGLSLNAIKVIIRDIYRKLGAVNRADAIRIAGSLKIV